MLAFCPFLSQRASERERDRERERERESNNKKEASADLAEANRQGKLIVFGCSFRRMDAATALKRPV